MAFVVEPALVGRPDRPRGGAISGSAGKGRSQPKGSGSPCPGSSLPGDFVGSRSKPSLAERTDPPPGPKGSRYTARASSLSGPRVANPRPSPTGAGNLLRFLTSLTSLAFCSAF